jgi:hypothetical protein
MQKDYLREKTASADGISTGGAQSVDIGANCSAFVTEFGQYANRRLEEAYLHSLKGDPMRRLLVLYLMCTSVSLVGQDVLGRQAVTPVTVPAATSMSHEETLVRIAYAKFAFASELEVVGHQAVEEVIDATPRTTIERADDQRLVDAKVEFQLSNFSVGNLKDIADRRALDVIQAPIGEMLVAETPMYSIAEARKPIVWSSIRPHWVPATDPKPSILNATVKDLHEGEWRGANPGVTLERYAAYTVVVSFQGKNRGPYRALFAFGHDAKGRDIVMPEDGTVDSTALARVIAVNLFPEALVHTRMRGNPTVIQWLEIKRRSDPSCSVGKSELCCDALQVQCGLNVADVAAELAKPLPTLQDQ